jgi:Tfp pilus assembly protein PilV
MVELLISMALASVGLMGLIALQVAATRGNANSREFIEAVSIAQDQLEAVESEQYATISNLAEGTCSQPGQPITNATCAQAITNGTNVTIKGLTTSYWPTGYTRCTSVNVNGATTNVRVIVQWSDASNFGAPQQHCVTIDTTRSP